MEGVDHIDVVQIDGGGFIRDVDGMLERQVPDRESLELGVAGLHAAQVFVIELREADGHFAAARPRRSHDDERARGLDILVAAVALLRNDLLRVVRIPFDRIVAVGLYAKLLQALAERLGRRLRRVLREDDAADVQSGDAERVDQAQHVEVVGNAEVAAHLVFLDVVGADGDDDFRLLAQREQHIQLAVRPEARQHARGVVVVEQLAAEFEIELAAELLDAFANLPALHLDVSVVVKADPSHSQSLHF